MVEICSSKTSRFYQTPRRHNREDSIVYSRCLENFKSNTVNYGFNVRINNVTTFLWGPDAAKEFTSTPPPPQPLQPRTSHTMPTLNTPQTLIRLVLITQITTFLHILFYKIFIVKLNRQKAERGGSPPVTRGKEGRVPVLN
jgi:hypothetical protein